MGDLDAPGVSDGAEDRLLVALPDSADLEVVVAAESAGGGRGDTAVHQNQFEAGDTLLGQVRQHQLAGPVLVGGGGHDHRRHSTGAE